MELFNTYIPREYLALKINYLKQQLELLPVVKVGEHIIGGTKYTRVSVDSHRYDLGSLNGNKYYDIWKTRDTLTRELNVYQAIWDSNFKSDPPKDCEPHPANRIVYVDTNKPVFMNKAYFDSLENDANTSYPKPDNYEFNGIKYRSAAEREIAIFYTESGIPFKYEPKVFLKGMAKATFPDFVPYFEEIDNCKFHEHFGMSDYSDYYKTSKIKFSNFANAGLVQDLDVIFTTSNDDTSFDPRHLSAKLNAAIYGNICMNKPAATKTVPDSPA
ncbi:MAG: hypothetical protein IKS75_00260 [Clostridiales bacterium]|nr:hypothetical protein [Clostridiales bacterium]